MYKDYYKILGIKRDSTIDEIKKAYRLQAMKYHPDKNKSGNAHEFFIEISEAYEILSNVDKRKIYDSLTKPKSDIDLRSEKMKFEEIVNESRMKAQAYSKISFDEFFDKIGFAIATGVRATVSLSTLLFSCVFFFGGLYGIFGYIQRVRDGDLKGIFDNIIHPIIILVLTVAGLLSLIQMFREATDKE